MTDRANLGNILMGLGRITEDDVARALAHQERHGGYFGEALMAMGLVSRDELEWGLASQFDLPYIFPDADSIDPDAADLVTPEWALAHLTMPILLTADALTVVVESPIRTDAVEELAARTDRRIELALASGERIRALIRQVYSRSQATGEPPRPTPMALGDALALALQAASERFGISVRGHRAWFWFRDGANMRRRRLDGHWEAALDRAMSPPPSAQVAGEERKRFRGQLNREGILTATEVEFLSGRGGREFLFKPVEERSALHDRFRAPPSGVLTEMRLLARSGAAHFLVHADRDLGAGLLPHLPALLLDPSWRAVHLTVGDGSREDVFQVPLPDDEEGRATEIERLRAFGFDVVTADAAELGPEVLDAIVDLASVTFVLWSDAFDAESARDVGLRWELRVTGAEGAPLEWALQPLRT